MVKSVMIAEDEFLIGFALKNTIQGWGFDVYDIIKTGEDLISNALSKDPDLLLIDIYLEDSIDGIDAVIEIYKKKEIPVIYMTASSDPATFDKASKTKMLRYLKKPYDSNELLEVIRSIWENNLKISM